MTKCDKKKLFAGKLDNSIILRYSKELVELADAYYCYGVPILNKIPAKVGNGLKICTRIYREIGLKIYSMDYYLKDVILRNLKNYGFYGLTRKTNLFWVMESCHIILVFFYSKLKY